MRINVLLVGLGAMTLVATLVQAQPAPGRFRTFVVAGAAANWDDRYSHGVAGPVPEGVFSFGVESDLTGVEVELNVPASRDRHYASPPYRYAGQTWSYLQQGHDYADGSATGYRAIDFAILHRRNFAVTPRATITALVGGGMIYREEKSASTTSEVLANGSPVVVHTFDGHSTRNYAAGIAGVDITLKLSAHWSLVPRLRVTAFPFSFLDDSGLAPVPVVARPEIAARWTF